MSAMQRTPRLASMLFACGWLSAVAAIGVATGRAASDPRLADAVERRDHAAVEALLSQRVDVNAAQADGATALHWAAHWNDEETVERLIRAGANVNAVNENGV